ncbi:MAG: uroporphyrinogen decarboxylase family protein [Clostridia bacterium]
MPMNGAGLIRSVIAGGVGDRIPFMPITMSFAARGIGVPYLLYATDHHALVKGQLAFAERYGADHVSAISDPAVEASDLGGGVIFYDDEPPANDDAKAFLLDKSRLASLKIIDPGEGKRMSNRLEAVAGLASAVSGTLLVEGWIEGPCAEGADLRGLSRLMMDFYDDPDFVRELFEFTTRQAISFALAQIQAGADLIGVGDAASSLMGPDIFVEFTLKHHKTIVNAIHEAGALARLHICGNTTELMPLLVDVPYDIIDLDTLSPVAKARAALGPDRILLGNIDTVSVVRGGTPEDVHRTLSDCLHDAGNQKWIVGAGCELPGDSPEANVMAMGTFARGHRP